VCGRVQVPQLSVPPQPSETVPQSAPWAAQVVGVQAPVPQTLGVPPPPQVCGAVQLPQLKVPPQPSGAVPQLFPSCAQVLGTHMHVLSSGEIWHVEGGVQPPQFTVPQPSLL